MMDLSPLFEALAALAVALLTTFLIPCLREKCGQTRFERLQKLISAAAQAAEQLFSDPGLGSEKKEWVQQALQNAGYTVDPSLFDTLLESAVHALQNDTQRKTS